MELGKNIKELRARDGLSQETLAERIYVSRQTVSNWETGRTYPDVQSLLMLSAVFNASIDELVKGDLETMKKELDTYKMTAWTWVMLGCAIAAIIAAVPIIVFKDTVGWPTFIPCIALWGFAIFAAIKVELIKKKHNLKTYSEILAFVKNSPLDREKMAWSKKHPTLAFLAKLLLGVAFALVVFVIAYFF